MTNSRPQKLVTVQRHLMEEQSQHPQASGDFTRLMWDLILAFKIISREVNKAGLVEILGITGEENVQGEQVQKLDAYAQDRIFKAMDHGGHLCCMGSEEVEDIILIPKEFDKGKYVLLYDPLDGSSNIDYNISIGTIFSIYKRISPGGGDGTLADCTQRGLEQVAAGYCIYGSSTMLVYTTGRGVHGFTLDPSVGEFLLSNEFIQIPSHGKVYSINEGNAFSWAKPTRNFIDYLKETDPDTRRPYTLRYVGSLVADIHRTLLQGGVFLYPSDTRDPAKPKAKLRLMYEANPMAFLIEQAGGKATTGAQRVLDVLPSGLHMRVPLILGSREEVDLYEKFVREASAVPASSMGPEQLTLLTDYYQLTMLGGYVGSNKRDQQAVFDLFFRKIPYDGGFCVAAGLEQAMEYILNLRFDAASLSWLKGQGFGADVLDYLRDFRFTGDVYAIPEGTLVFPHEPLLRVSAPMPEAQLLESTLLNLINFQTLIATKAARVCLAAQNGVILEFGLRRAQGPDGALSASRAAFIGGCNATSNTLAGLRYGIPVAGTMAHSWVMSFSSELESFRAYAAMYPDHCMLLVDTYDTLAGGVPNAITVGRELEARGHKFVGIRLDSGDLSFLSKQARRMLDDAGLSHAIIAASNELDEWIIHDLLSQGARIDVWGVGTSLVVARGASALGGVYKLVAAQDGDELRPRIKVSGNPEQITDPGVKQVWRVWDSQGTMLGDVLALEHETFNAGDRIASRHGTWFHQRVNFEKAARVEPLLVPVIRNGKPVYQMPTFRDIQARTRDQLLQLRDEHKRIVNAHLYWVGLTEPLYDLRARLLSAASVTTVSR